MSTIGRVTWGDPPRTAILHGDGTWECPEIPELGPSLTDRYEESYRSDRPYCGFPGVRELHAFAESMGGVVTLEPQPKSPAGVVY
jgi:hypothetical protein